MGWPDLAFGMSSGASAVHGWIPLAELVPTDKFSRPHLLWHAGLFRKTLKRSILDQFGAATPQNYMYKLPIHRPGGLYYILYQSEGFPQTGYFIPAHVGAGAGQIWASFRRRLWPGPLMWTQKMWTPNVRYLT